MKHSEQQLVMCTPWPAIRRLWWKVYDGFLHWFWLAVPHRLQPAQQVSLVTAQCGRCDRVQPYAWPVPEIPTPGDAIVSALRQAGEALQAFAPRAPQ